MHAVRTLFAAAALAAAGLQAAAPQAAIATPAAPDARVIVGFRADAPTLRRQALAAPDDAAQLQRRADTLAARAGVPLTTGRALGTRQQVVRARGLTSEQLAARLAAHPEVEWAVPDRRRRAVFVPNDPLYPEAVRRLGPGPDAGQWYLRTPDDLYRSAADFERAWDLRRGDAGTVVAVIDTGVRPEHPDLAGVLLPGIDTIDGESASSFIVANDGDGADGDASDPGDWVTLAESQSDGVLEGCLDGPSSWHGTLVSTIVAAVGNEGVGMAGAAHGIRVLPVRVLGKCGGYDSDIIAGMLWAAGLQTVAGIVNRNPAQVLNISLGGPGECEAPYIDAVRRINATGAVVVAAAGNDAGLAVGSPANCPGVIGVGGLRHAGSKVGFSDLGPEIALSAPGGNCVNIGEDEPCLYPILAGTNTGTTRPVLTASGSTWTDSYNSSFGTSFSAPLVSAAAALVRADRPALTPAQVRAVLQASARPFPQDGADNGTDPTPVPACVPPTGTEQLQCYCPNPETHGLSLCGAGMLDAPAALQASRTGFAQIALDPLAPLAGQTLALDGRDSLPPPGRRIIAYAWALVDGGGAATAFGGSTTAATASLPTSAAGTVVVRLTVTDDTGAQLSRDRTITVAPTSTDTDADSGGGGAASPAWLLGLALATAALRRRRR